MADSASYSDLTDQGVYRQDHERDLDNALGAASHLAWLCGDEFCSTSHEWSGWKRDYLARRLCSGRGQHQCLRQWFFTNVSGRHRNVIRSATFTVCGHAFDLAGPRSTIWTGLRRTRPNDESSSGGAQRNEHAWL